MWGWPWHILGAIRAIVTVGEGSFFQKKQKLLTKFPGLATSDRHNFAMITDRRKFTAKRSLYGMSSFLRINSKSFLCDARSVQERYLPKFSATFHV